MKVHHLNCGTMNMPTAPMVCHVLLIETDNGLVLVDSGTAKEFTGSLEDYTDLILGKNQPKVQQWLASA